MVLSQLRDAVVIRGWRRVTPLRCSGRTGFCADGALNDPLLNVTGRLDLGKYFRERPLRTPDGDNGGNEM
jgi:hypothetical protein